MGGLFQYEEEVRDFTFVPGNDLDDFDKVLDRPSRIEEPVACEIAPSYSDLINLIATLGMIFVSSPVQDSDKLDL